ncbi:hypothetical protein HNR42_002762 [Deinobacterium chartae]|uniref:PEGA domain-containing protein n=1 Tax=Deinobacterium chartae TaxID=521158 RepID=A0A841I2T4_9DEIO|nr:PEGA domain-containing protein [Deinobacterium chartae]MBB6099324.1 hypothetical protein [Deinobacterium chartae]
MKKVIATGLLCAALIGGLSSCATIIKGTEQTVPVASTPEGAEVLVNGVSYGRTPLQLRLKTNQSYTIVVRADGKERIFNVVNRVGTLWVVLDVLTGLVPVVVDAATGAWYELDPNSINVNLE